MAAEPELGIGFAIPVDSIKAILSDFTKYGRVRRPSLAIASLAIGPDLAEQIGLPADYGVLVQKVVAGGAAERAGLRGGTQQAYLGNTPIYLGGDLIVAIDEDRVTNPQGYFRDHGPASGRRYCDRDLLPRIAETYPQTYSRRGSLGFRLRRCGEHIAPPGNAIHS